MSLREVQPPSMYHVDVRENANETRTEVSRIGDI